MIFNRNVFIEEQQYAQNMFLCKWFKKKKKKNTVTNTTVVKPKIVCFRNTSCDKSWGHEHHYKTKGLFSWSCCKPARVWPPPFFPKEEKSFDKERKP